MTSTGDRSAIAYLAPELPALSETFVYEEMAGVERTGFRVVPIALRRPAVPACDQDALAGRVTVLYDQPSILLMVAGLIQAPLFGTRLTAALRLLLSDLHECGIHRLDTWKLTYQFLAAIRLARILNRKNCVHLHVHFAHTPAQIAMYASALTGVPFTITAHANDIFERGLLLQRKAERALRILAISDYNLRYLEHLGVAKSRLTVVRCGVTFPPRSKPEVYGPKNGFVIGTLGRMVEKKGFDVLIRAVAALKTFGYAIEIRIAGDGPLDAELRDLVGKLGIADISRFEGTLPHQRVADWMQELDAFVLACKKSRTGDTDGIPVVLMEAMSQSVPVVSTRLSGIPELVKHEETGLLAVPEDVDDLARQIARLIESESLGARLAERAREHVMDEFSQSTNLVRLIECFGLGEQGVASGTSERSSGK